MLVFQTCKDVFESARLLADKIFNNKQIQKLCIFCGFRGKNCTLIFSLWDSADISVVPRSQYYLELVV